MLGELSVGTDGDHVLWAPSFPHQALVGDVPSLTLSSGHPGLTQPRALSWVGNWIQRSQSRCDVSSSEVRGQSPPVLNRPSPRVFAMPAIL